MAATGGDRMALPSAAVIEFLGLPGVGKSTLVSRVVADLRRQGHDPLVTEDFVSWLGRRSVLEKLMILLSETSETLSQSFCAIRFAFSLRPLGTISIRRVALIPFVNVCFDRFLREHPDRLIIMDQANMQLLWSLGSFADSYSKVALSAACAGTTGARPRIYVCLAADASLAAQRIRARNSAGSRFDVLDEEKLARSLIISVQLISDIRAQLVRLNKSVVDLDAAESVDGNAQQVRVAVVGA